MRYEGQDSLYSWIICFAGCVNLIMFGGFGLASGMFYIMFKEAIEATDSELAFAVSFNPALIHLAGPIAGKLCQYWGCRAVAMLGCVVSVIGVAFSAFSTKVFHLYISYGLIAGIGLGMMLNASAAVIAPYFNKHKRIATAIVWSGPSIGSLLFAPIINQLESFYGWRGALLLLAGIAAQALVASALFRPFSDSKSQHKDKPDDSTFVEHKSAETHYHQNGIYQNEMEREEEQLSLNQKQSAQRSPTKGQFNLKSEMYSLISLFKIVPFSSLFWCIILGTFPDVIVLTHFGNYVLTLGYTKPDVVTMYMLFGISSTIGRPLSGVFGQLTGANVSTVIMIPELISGIITLVLAADVVHSIWFLYAYTVLFKFLMAPYNALFAAIVLEHVPPEQAPTGLGLLLFAEVPAYLVAAPLAAWIHNYSGVYEYAFYLAGGLLVLSGLTLAPGSYTTYKKNRLTLPNQV